MNRPPSTLDALEADERFLGLPMVNQPREGSGGIRQTAQASERISKLVRHSGGKLPDRIWERLGRGGAP